MIRNTIAYVETRGEAAAVHYINISSGALAERQLMDYVEDQLASHHLLPGKIGFEISENDLKAHPNEAMEFASAVKGLGCHVALDGFASTFSLLRSLENHSYDLIKISDGSSQVLKAVGLRVRCLIPPTVSAMPLAAKRFQNARTMMTS